MAKRQIKERNLFLIYIFTFLTFGLYGIYWWVATKNEINSLGAKIPTALLLIIPIANLYWFYRYCEGFAEKVKKDKNALLYFIIVLLIAIIMPAIVQSELNKLA